MEHPITPPPELVAEWLKQFYGPATTLGTLAPGEASLHVAAAAAQWGADQELEACCDTLQRHAHWDLAVFELMDDRRPKPQSLRKQALRALEDDDIDVYLIRRALEALPND